MPPPTTPPTSSTTKRLAAARQSFVDKVPKKNGAAKKLPDPPPVSEEDRADITDAVKNVNDPDTRRSGLLTLFKLSLREELEPGIVNLGGAEACIKGLEQEDKGSAAKRAGLQALRNLAASPLCQAKLIEVLPTVLVKAIGEEASGSGQREAALEGLRNLASFEQNRPTLVKTEAIFGNVLNAAKTETQGSNAREAALAVLEFLATDVGKATVQVHNLTSVPSSPKIDMRARGLSSVKSLRSEDGFKAAPASSSSSDSKSIPADLDLDAYVSICMDTVANEQRGSQSRTVAVRTLGNLAFGGEQDRLMKTPGLMDACLKASKEEAPGSETRALVFALFADLASHPKLRIPLMKTRDLAETILQAVREEPAGSMARECAMYVVGRLCMEPENRPVFLKGTGEGLVSVCLKAAGQEPPGSSGRAAALEVLAGLALAPENQALLFNTPGLVKMAAESAIDNGIEHEQIREAGLDVIAALALLPANQRPLFSTQGVPDAVCKNLVDEPKGSPLRAAAIAAAHSLAAHPENLKAIKVYPKLVDSLMYAVQTEDIGSRARTEAICALREHSLLDPAKAFAQKEFVSSLVDASRQELVGSKARTAAFELVSMCITMNSGARDVLQANGALHVALQTVDAVAPSSGNKPSAAALGARGLLKATQQPSSRLQAPPPPEALERDVMAGLAVLRDAIHCSMALPDSTFETCSMLTGAVASSSATVEGKDLHKGVLAVLVASASCMDDAMALQLVTGGAGMILLKAIEGESPILMKEAMLALRYLTPFDSCVPALQEKLMEAVVIAMINMTDKGDEPQNLQAPCLAAMIHLMFHVPYSTLVRGHGRRGDLEAAVGRIMTRGCNEEAWFESARLVAGFSSLLRIMGNATPATLAKATLKDAKTMQKVWVMGPQLARPATEAVCGALVKSNDALKKAKKPQIEAVTLDQDSNKLKTAAKKKSLVDDVFAVMTGTISLLVYCVSDDFETDPMYRLFTYLASMSKVPAMAVKVATSVSGTKSLGYPWFRKFQTEVKYVGGVIPATASVPDSVVADIVKEVSG